MRRDRAPRIVVSIALFAAAAVSVLSIAAPTSGVLATAVPASPATHSSVSGRPMPRGDLARWRQVFAENFRTPARVGAFPGRAYRADWGVYGDGWKDTTGHGVYMPSKVLSVKRGALDWYIHTASGKHLVAAPVPAVGTHGAWGGRTYGRFAIRFRAAPLHGYKTAFMLWPDSGRWPAHGEIDFPEGDLDDRISAYAHYADPRGGQKAFDTNARYPDWHTAVTVWTRKRIVFRLDGRVIGSSTQKVPSQPMHWVLQAETSTSGATPSDRTAGHLRVDWVVAYTRKGP